MFVLLNPGAAGGTGAAKMKRCTSLLASGHEWHIHVMNGEVSTNQALAEALHRGETDFVAAGGDGTVNTLLHRLLTLSTPEERQRIRLGAIGLGSSNDFHKPCQKDQAIRGIACKLDFTHAQARDVGVLLYDENGSPMTRHFLVNASIGAAAEANRLFNTPGSLVSLLKRIHTPTAIFHSALKTIRGFTGFSATIDCGERGSISTSITNLSVMKSPHLSGSLCYPHNPDYADGRFTVYLSHHVNRRELLGLMWGLRQRAFRPSNKKDIWRTSSLSVISESPFVVEFDGEVVMTRSVRFSILSAHLKVCP